MPAKRLKEFLDSHNIKYVTISHSRAFTAQETATSAHIPGKELAKTVVVKMDGKMAMAVLPASSKVDFDLLKKVTGSSKIEIASEKEFKDIFPE
ncbi:MAG TPA: aminoacyl-tRNA deacylase, partial [Candidatus Wunengus sp. YC60]|uniref:aminoacyl-tRNA deacylase n=1 Tax=Candidatus Wunengus sp. YC60 TaxID=3367697 RepID=UPI004027070D